MSEDIERAQAGKSLGDIHVCLKIKSLDTKKSDAVLNPVTPVYETCGRLNDSTANAILFCHGELHRYTLTEFYVSL